MPRSGATASSAPHSRTPPGRRRPTPRRPTATSATRSAPCWPRKADVVDAEGAYALPFPVLSEVDAAALGVVLEDGASAAWVRVLDQAAERSTRELAVGVLSAAEIRAVGWRIAAGQTPVTSAFPGLPKRTRTPGPCSDRAEERVGDGDRGTAGLTALDEDGEGQIALRSAEPVAHEPAVRVGRVLSPYSAVPVLPDTWPRPSSAFAVPETTARIISRSARAPPPGPAVPGRRPAPGTSNGAAGPLSILPRRAPSGPGSSDPALTDRLGRLLGVVLGHRRRRRSWRSASTRCRPRRAPPPGAARRSSRWGRPVKVVLQECANASRNAIRPRSNLSSFSNSLPYTTVVPGQSTMEAG